MVLFLPNPTLSVIILKFYIICIQYVARLIYICEKSNVMHDPQVISEDSLRKQVLLALVLILLGVGGLMCLMSLYLGS